MRKLTLVLALLAMAAMIAAPAQAGKDDPWTGIISGYVEGGSEPFPYGPIDSYYGQLNGNGGWTGTATDKIWVDCQEIGINGGGATNTDANWDGLNYRPDSGKIVVGIKMAAGGGADSFFWDFQAFDTGNHEIGRFYGKSNMAKGRNGLDQITAEGNFGGYTPLWMVIDTAADMTEFFCDGTSLGTLAFHGDDTLGKIRLNAWGRGEDMTVWMDNLTYGTLAVPEPSSLAALSMLGLGALGFIRRRRV